MLLISFFVLNMYYQRAFQVRALDYYSRRIKIDAPDLMIL